MKLATSSNDFIKQTGTIPAAVEMFGRTKFRNINLEMDDPYMTEAEWKRQAGLFGEAAAKAGITYTTAHAPCLNPFGGDQEKYDYAVQAIRNSIEICGVLGIPRIVVHAGQSKAFIHEDFYRENKKFYGEFFDLMEKHGVLVLTENMTDGTYCPLSTGRELRDFMEYVDHPLLGACWDTAHGNLNTKVKEEGQYASIVAIGDKLKGLHIADNFGDGPHHHTWPFAGIVNFDSVMQGLVDVKYDGVFTFEASYTLIHHENLPYHRQPWEHNGQTVTKLLDPSVELKRKAVDLMYDVGQYLLESYGCFEE